MEKKPKAPLYLGDDPLRNAVLLFLKNYTQEELGEPLETWRLQAMQNLFLAGENCGLEERLDMEIEKVPISKLESLFEPHGLMANIRHLKNLFSLITDVKHSYCIVGYFIAYRAHISTINESNERRSEAINALSELSNDYKRLLNGGSRPNFGRLSYLNRMKTTNSSTLDLYLSILDSFDGEEKIQSSFENKNFDDLKQWQRDFCNRNGIKRTTSDHDTNDKMSLAAKNQFFGLLSKQTKNDFTAIGTDFSFLLSLFERPPDAPKRIKLEVSHNVESSNALLQSWVQSDKQFVQESLPQIVNNDPGTPKTCEHEPSQLKTPVRIDPTNKSISKSPRSITLNEITASSINALRQEKIGPKTSLSKGQHHMSSESTILPSSSKPSQQQHPTPREFTRMPMPTINNLQLQSPSQKGSQQQVQIPTTSSANQSIPAILTPPVTPSRKRFQPANNNKTTPKRPSKSKNLPSTNKEGVVYVQLSSDSESDNE